MRHFAYVVRTIAGVFSLATLLVAATGDRNAAREWLPVIQHSEGIKAYSTSRGAIIVFYTLPRGRKKHGFADLDGIKKGTLSGRVVEIVPIESGINGPNSQFLLYSSEPLPRHYLGRIPMSESATAYGYGYNFASDEVILIGALRTSATGNCCPTNVEYHYALKGEHIILVTRKTFPNKD